MSRPTHIAALDEALERSLSAIETSNAEVARVLDRRIVAFDAINADINAATSARADVYSDVRRCAESIKTLGYALTLAQRKKLDAVGSYSLTNDMNEARARAAATKDDYAGWVPEMEDDWVPEDKR